MQEHEFDGSQPNEITLTDHHGKTVVVWLETRSSTEFREWDMPEVAVLLIGDVTPDHPREDGLHYDPEKADLLEGTQVSGLPSSHSILGMLQEKLIHKYGAGNVYIEQPSTDHPLKDLQVRRINGHFPYFITVQMHGGDEGVLSFVRDVKEALADIKHEIAPPHHL